MRRSRNRNWLAEKPGLPAAGEKAFRLYRRKGRGREGLFQPLEEPVSCPRAGSNSGTTVHSFHALFGFLLAPYNSQPATELCCETQISVAPLVTNLPSLVGQEAEAPWGAAWQYPPKRGQTKRCIASIYSDPAISLLGSLWKDTGAGGERYKMLMPSHWEMAK